MNDSRLTVTPKLRQVLSESMRLRLKGKENQSDTTPVTNVATSIPEKLPPPPFPANEVLKDVVAYVEVRSVDEDRSEAVAYYLELMGATVSKYMNRKVTHVIFRNGRRSTYDKAVKLGIHMVTVLWIEECRQKNCVVNEKDYAATIPEEFTSPFFSGKIKRFKPLIPKVKELEIDVTKSLERRMKRRERYRNKRDFRELLKSPKNSIVVKFDDLFPSLVTKLRVKCHEKNEEIVKTDTPTKILDIGKPETRNFNFEEDEISSSQESTATWNIPLIERILSKSLSATPCKDNETVPRNAKRQKLFSQPEEMLEFTPQRRPGQNIVEIMQSCSRSKSTDSSLTNDSSSITNTSSESVTERKVDDASLSDYDFVKLRIESDDSLVSPVKVKCETKIEDILKSSECESENERIEKLREHRLKCRRPTKQKLLRKCVDKCQTASPEKPSIVLTCMDQKEQETVRGVVASLGRLRIVRTVDETTTHVICGSPRRTLNVLLAVVRGCWLVSLDWVFRSVEEGRWIMEDDFEIRDLCPGIACSRIQRQSLSSSDQARSGIFADVGLIYLYNDVAPPKKDMEQLIILGGGKVTNQRRLADVVIGGAVSSRSRIVSGKWVVDCISEFKLLSSDEYLLQ